MAAPLARIESLYHAARMRPPHERTAFLTEACGGDEHLRVEVESLLAEHAATDGFLSGVISAAPALAVGERIGPYEVVAPIGAGGMGEVYRASDAKLSRDVAIKVLPPLFAENPDRLARFQREARLLAAFSHPNIAQIYGLEESNGVDAIVMELVDGETLAARIARGRLPVSDALSIARQITEALEAAHERGVVHRDLKPSNVALTAAGIVKVLDFGLAKPLAATAAHALGSSSVSMPAEGTLVGTVAYMSPEQARGQNVDTRTDIWAFGCILFEMLTGRQAFAGATTSDCIAAILEREPDWSVLPAKLPSGVQRLLLRCLEKDPAQRLRSIADARFDLDDAGHERRSIARSGGKRRNRVPSRGVASPREWIAWGTAALAVAVAGAVLSFAVWSPRRAPTLPLMSASILLPDGIDRALHLALSSDGQQLAYVGLPKKGDVSYIWIRSLDKREAQMLRGTGEARYPFWSSNRRSLGFFAEGKLKTIDVTSGVIRELCPAPDGAGGSWSGHTIVFAPDRRGSALSRVSEDAHECSPVAATVLQSSETTHEFPAFLADGTHFVFTALEKNGATKLEVASLDDLVPHLLYRGPDPSSGSRRLPSQDRTQAFVAGGTLVFWRGGYVQAAPLDEKKWRTGDPVVVVPNVDDEDGVHRAFAVSNGILVYRAGGPSPVQRLTWLSRDGKEQTPLGEPGRFDQVLLTRDDRRAIVTRYDGSKRALSVIDLARPNEERTLAKEGARPILSLDGLRVLFTRQGQSDADIYSMRVDGGDERLEVDKPESGKASLGWSPSGSILYVAGNKETLRADLWERPASGGARVLLPADDKDTDFDGAAMTVAGDLIATIAGGKTARSLYVRPTRRGTPRLVATGTGLWEPRWRSDGRELYYIDIANHRLMAVDVSSADPLQIGIPHPVLEFQHWQYAPSRDGQRFLAAVPLVSSNPPHVIEAMLNWLPVINK